jgi:hypothetical protein
VQQYRGRVVDSPGDNILSEFSSVVRPFSIFDGQRFTIYDEKLKVTRHDTVARYAILG